MARPKKQGLDYFSIDCDFFQDEKVIAISGEFGIYGELTIIKLLCAIYRKGYYYTWDELARAKMLRDIPGITGDLLDQIVARLVKWGFFDKNLFESDMILTSKGIQKRYFEATKSRKRNDELDYILINTENNGVSDELTPIKSELTTQSKVKQSKINNKNISTVVDIQKEKETTINSEITTTTTTTADNINNLSLEDAIANLKNDTEWRQEIAQTINTNSNEEVAARIDDFKSHCIRYGRCQHRDMKDAKSHFVLWLKKENLNTKTTEYEDYRKDTYIRRRGTDANCAEPEDNYYDPF